MSPPIYTPDGSEVSEIVLPDGSTASEVIGPDGNIVFEAAPDIPDTQNLYSRWDANEETYSDGATAVSPTDQAGSFDATDGNGVKFSTSGTNGNNAYVFDGGDDYAVVPNSTTDFEFLHDGSGGSIYIVTSIDTNNVSNFDPMLYSGGFDGTGMGLGMDDSGGVLNKINNSRGNTGGGDRNALIYESHYATTSNYTSDAVQYQDNSQVREYDPTTTTGASNVDLAIGAQRDGTPTFDGEILAILIYDVQHDSATRSEVYNYLNNRYS